MQKTNNKKGQKTRLVDENQIYIFGRGTFFMALKKCSWQTSEKAKKMR
jgi:hypothetical protein